MLSVEGAGFVTQSMAEEALAPFVADQAPPRVLVDVRNVSGYEAACVGVAQGWLSRATGLGVERIAFVANSSVVRTAAEVVARHVHAPLRTFDAVANAQAWLEGPRDVRPPSGAEVSAARPRA